MTAAAVSAGPAVCVLGSSRGGTSLTARLLSLAGVSLGPPEGLLQKDLRQLAGEGEEVLTRAREANPEGFFEHYRITRLNERILRRLGGSWREPPSLRPGWEASEQLDPEREEARALLEQSFAGRPLWGWKDPRNSLTLPFWRRLVPELRCVVCLRNPLDVAASLQRRDGIDFEHGVKLWQLYTAAALANTEGRSRLLVPYEGYFEDPRRAAARLAAFAGCAGAFDGVEARRRLEEAVDERLWRNRTPPDEVARDARVPRSAVSLFRHGERLAATEAPAPAPTPPPPPAAAPAGRALAFVVIGVQKGGTTSLWQYLRGHPRIALPDYKEWPVFCSADQRLAERLAWFMRSAFADPAADALLGHISTHYMMGMGEADVETIAGRIAAALPGVRLIALLRDPVERAMSHYRMSVRRGLERRSFDAVVEQELRPERLAAARSAPSEVNSYLVQGEYGRILQIYRERFPAERIHVEPTVELERDPGALLDRVLAFLGLPPGYRPEGLGVRHHRGGARPRVDAAGEQELRAFMRDSVGPLLAEADAERAGHAFDFFLRTWNVVPDDVLPPLAAQNRRRLEAHYRADAERLAALGVAAPWLERYGSSAGRQAASAASSAASPSSPHSTRS